MFKIKFTLVTAFLWSIFSISAGNKQYRDRLTPDLFTGNSARLYTSETKITYRALFNKWDGESFYFGYITDSKQGIVVTENTNNYVLAAVEVEWDAQNTNKDKMGMEFYGKNKAYSAPSDLRSTSATTKGELLGTLSSFEETTRSFDTKYPYVGMKEKDKKANYLTSITFVWEDPNSSEDISIESLSALEDVEDGTSVSVACNTTVGFSSGRTAYVTDGASWIKVDCNKEYNAGDVIPTGWEATYSIVNEIPTLTATSEMPVSTEKGAFSFAEYETSLPTEVNAIVKLKNVSLTTSTPTGDEYFDATFNEETVCLNNQYIGSTVPAGKYNITAVTAKNGGKYTFLPIDYEYIFENIETQIVPSDGNIIIAGIPKELDLYYKIISQSSSAVEPMSVDHSGYTLGQRNSESNYVIPAELPCRLEMYTYHSPTDTKGEVITRDFDKDINTDIDEIEAEDIDAVYYNLRGIRVDVPQSGKIYIKKEGSNSRVIRK